MILENKIMTIVIIIIMMIIRITYRSMTGECLYFYGTQKQIQS